MKHEQTALLIGLMIVWTLLLLGASCVQRGLSAPRAHAARPAAAGR